MAANTDSNGGYGIGAVVKITGLTDHTIRVWERRYEAVVADRTDTGRRVYSSADIEKLGLLKQLTDEGFAIGRIAGLSVSALRKEISNLGNVSPAATPDRIRIAVLGDILPGQLLAAPETAASLEIAVSESSPDRLQADLAHQKVDIVIVETAVLDNKSLKELRKLMSAGNARGGVMIYNFGRSGDIGRAASSNISVLRAPSTNEEIGAAAVRAYTRKAAAKKPEQDAADRNIDPDWRFSGKIAPRRFTQQQLATLANTTTAIDCECPHHLAQLVNDLSSFEIYSANCANRDSDDAALHRYLHQTTAEARSLIELALEKVAKAEGLTY